MDFHLLPNFVNLSLIILLPVPLVTPAMDEEAVLWDGPSLRGQLATDPDGALVFQAAGLPDPIPIRNIRKVINRSPSRGSAGSTPSHRLSLWGTESLSGSVEQIVDETIRLTVSGGGAVDIPVYLVSKVEHFQGDVVILRDDFEADQAARQTVGAARVSSDRASSGDRSMALLDVGDSVEFALAESIASGWFEARFFDPGSAHPGIVWLCELVFESKAGPRTVQILLSSGADSYGLSTPQGPAFPVQRIARRPGWHRIGMRFSPARTTVLLDDTLLAHRESGVGLLQAVRFAIRATEADEPPAAKLTGYVDDVQFAETISSSTERQPSRDQDDVLLLSGDQLFGRIHSATARQLTITGEFGSQTLLWTEVHAVHFTPRSPQPRAVHGLRVRVQYGVTGIPTIRGLDSDLLEGVITGLREEAIEIEHPFISGLSLPRGQLKELEFLAPDHYLTLDPVFHHFGDGLNTRLQVPHPEGSERSWEFQLEHVPGHAALVLHVVGMETMAPGAEHHKRLENDEWRTYASINGQKIDPLGLNHLLPLNYRGSLRLSVPIPPGILQRGQNTLRIHQTPHKDDPHSFDDCGIFGIGLEFGEE